MGLGPGNIDVLPAKAHTFLTSGLPILLRTQRHPCVESGPLAAHFLTRGAAVIALDEEYETGRTFEETYEAIVERVLRTHATLGDLVYAVPGHPLIGESTIRLLLERAKTEGIEIKIVGAPSFVDACLEALCEPVVDHLHVVDAHLLTQGLPYANPNLNVDGPMLLYQVHDKEIASDVKLALMDAGYPDEMLITVLKAAGVPHLEAVYTIPLVGIDRIDADHLTTLWVPALPREHRPADLNTLLDIMARLRDPDDGCPWDLKQSHQTLRTYLLEEAYEVAEAIDEDDPDALVDELGDVLLQIAFHAQLGRESGMFTMSDVCHAICEKMIRRHPHVFSDTVADTSDAVIVNWNAIKAQEKAEKGILADTTILSSISKSLPALDMAMEVSRKTVAVGFEWPESNDLKAKCQEELAELLVEWEAMLKSPTDERARARFASEFGDVLFTLVNVARWAKINPETSLRQQIQRFKTRWCIVETLRLADALEWEQVTTRLFRVYWDTAKQETECV